MYMASLNTLTGYSKRCPRYVLISKGNGRIDHVKLNW